MRCLISGKYGMLADILRQGAGTDATNTDVDNVGEWQTQQDPETGEIIRVWVPVVDDDPDTPAIEGYSFQCMARPIISNGIKTAGTDESFGIMYENLDYLKITFPASVILTKRDRVTNIRDPKTGQILWLEEELEKTGGNFRASVFNVNGVSPVFDPFNRWVENIALLERAV